MREFRNSIDLIATVTVACIALLGVLACSNTHAQSVSRYVQFTQPTGTLTHDSTGLLNDSRPHVALVRSKQTAEVVAGMHSPVTDAIYQWEIFLLGLQIPYAVLHDVDLKRAISKDYQVLILPGVESLSDKQKERITEFLERGGGVIASGRLGYYDERGRRRGSAFMTRVLGAEIIDILPRQPYGLIQSIEGDSPLIDGIPAGYQLNIASQNTIAAVKLDSENSLGRITTFKRSDQANFSRTSLLHFNSFGQGRIFWTQFLPQHVSREADQQTNYQRLIINALAYLSDTKSVSVGRWPFGNDMALTVAALPSPGFDVITYLTNYERFVETLVKDSINASFYLASDEISTFPDLYRSVVETGSEIAISADNDCLLVGEKLNRQYERFSGALQSLGMKKAHGVYPPGGFLDGNTIRALDRLDAVYVLRPGGSGFAPGHLDWWEFVDYKDAFVDPYSIGGPTEYSSGSIQGNRLPVIATIPVADVQPEDYDATYDRIQSAHGHYMVPFYPEQTAAYSMAFGQLEALISKAKEDNTWIATASDVLVWTRTRANITPRIVSSGDDEMRIEVQNFTTNVITDAYLIVSFPEGLPVNLELSDSNLKLHRIEQRDEIHIELGSLVSGVTSFILFWDR